MMNNTYEYIDNKSSNMQNYLRVICRALGADVNEIQNIQPLSSGMTNHSYIFFYKGERYIIRVPGEGTDKLLNRQNEYHVYQQIKPKSICDDILFFDAESGYKITKYVEGSHKCDPRNWNDVERCIRFLKQFHQLHLQVGHCFDVFGEIEHYEKLIENPPGYVDYLAVRSNAFSLKKYIDSQQSEWCLSHIDAVPDNFLLTDEREYLIDWEYAAMQDPHIDIAMFAIYALYDKADIDRLIDIYFDNQCPKCTRLKIYCYVAVCGLLWSVWCEYKASLGIRFGEYSLAQYRYAKDFYQIFMEENNDTQG